MLTTWIFFSIFAGFIWAVVNTLDKYVLNKWIKKPIIPAIITGMVGLISSFLIFIIHGFSAFSSINILLALITGIFYGLMSIFYFQALKIEEASRIIPLYSLSPLFILILAKCFLDEVLTPVKYFGVFLSILGAVLISSKSFKDLFRIRSGKAILFVMLSALSISINAVLSKYLLKFTDFWTIFAYTRIGTMITIIPLFCIYLPELININKKYGKKVITIMSGNEVLNLLAVLLVTIATSIGSVTLVNALSSLHLFFLLLITIILSIFRPKILKEEFNKSILSLKIIATILIFTGVILMT